MATSSPSSPNSFRFGSLELDVAAGELLRRGKRLRLQPQVLRLLVLLLERPGEVVTREELQRAIWPADTFVDFEVGLSAAVYKLRQALGDSAETPRFIETIPRRGFRFIAPVRRKEAEPAEQDQAPAVPASSVPPPGLRAASRFWGTGFLIVLLAVLVAGGWMVFGAKPAANASLRTEGPPADARRAYQLGRYEFDRWTRDDLKRSAEYFEQAARYDPGYAAAWAGLARSKTLSVTLGFVPADRGIPEAKEAALKALAANPSLPEAHTAMAALLMCDWSWIAAEGELRRAVALDPNNSDAHQLYGYYLLTQGRAAGAVDEMRRAQALDPNSPNKRNSLAVAYFHTRHFDEALSIWRDNTAVEANSARRHSRLAFIYESKGMRSDSFAEMVAFLRSAGRTNEAADVERIFQAQGYEAARKFFLRHDIEVLRARGGSDHEIAADYAVLRQNDRALVALARAVERRETPVIYLSVDPRFDSLRRDARFDAILRSVGLPAH